MPDLFLTEAMGYAAATLTTAAFVPQVAKTWRTGSARDLSLTMLLAFSTGVVLWMVYGILIGSWPVILANGTTAALTGSILAFKIRECCRRD